MRAVNSPIWQLGEDEKRSIAPIAYHTAEVIATHAAMLRDAAEGKPLPVPGGRWTIDGVAQWNAAEAEKNADVTQEQVHHLLVANAAAALEVISGLTDEQLDRELSAADREAVGPFNPELSTAGQIVEQCLVGHVRVHLTSVQAAVGRSRLRRLPRPLLATPGRGPPARPGRFRGENPSRDHQIARWVQRFVSATADHRLTVAMSVGVREPCGCVVGATAYSVPRGQGANGSSQAWSRQAATRSTAPSCASRTRASSHSRGCVVILKPSELRRRAVLSSW